MDARSSETAPPVSFDSRDLSVRIYQALKQDILDGELAPGARLSLDELAVRFGVSVSPVRDSLRLLASDGLAELRSRRGAFVTMPSPRDIREVFQFRIVLESAAIDWAIAAGEPVVDALHGQVEAMTETMVGETHTDYLAYLRHDRGFHRILIDAIGNAKIAESYDSLASFTLIARMLHHAWSHRATDTLAEHRAIIDAIAANDGAAARAAIRTHLDRACADLVRQVEALGHEKKREQSAEPASILPPGLVDEAVDSGRRTVARSRKRSPRKTREA